MIKQIFTCALVASIFTSFAAEKKPKLVLQITVDQLRADLPLRYMHNFKDGGFRYLYEEGTVYTDAHHPHANTETIVGHTTLATGATPSVHGMIGNVWVDRATGKTTYNIEDPNYHLLSKNADVDQKNEIDPTQKAASTDGRSPMGILSTTFSDELAIFTKGQSKVFGVSVKDRGAVSMAGHAGKAYWFSKKAGSFVTSNYYQEKYPAWLETWNSSGILDKYKGQSWTLSKDKSEYELAHMDDVPWETDLAGFGKKFPHPWKEGKYFTTLLTLSPAGDELTLNFAKELMKQEKVGQDNVTDYLSVSFSSTDYVGHIFGPSSLEMEDNLYQLDGFIANLLEYVDDTVGLENTLVVLSSDHGAPEVPGYLNSLKIPAKFIHPCEWPNDSAIKSLEKEFDIKTKLIEKYQHPYVYFSKEVYSRSDKERLAIEKAAVDYLTKINGVNLAISSRALENNALPNTAIHKAVLNNFHPERSGDIYIVFDSNCFINDFDGLEVACTHGSPWAYDTHVPLIFAGFGIDDQKVPRRVSTCDLALTLSNIIGCRPPSGSVANVLEEVLED
ncbi:putative alkaline phosphatase [Lentisphaera araneosa HTCC2155]|uniref:Putative alkaline phosphatase n=1 Tax=Lentisphaera araneosa HTCC2155 TaxID=313628 RepID=A6DS56_9BACT|nr:alkaline phosphatase family protein [Lentisphaera araneosa]EDM25516.1 putative alkaline phosphatase [Lentisphaera araneosa HTCC2155]